MVDFRYHLVSLVSVFLALAVGIILGAGPLQNSLGNALSGQVESLRDSRDELRVELDDATAQLEGNEAALSIAGSQLLPGSLEGRNVAIVLLPGVQDDSAVEDQLKVAGATISGKVTLTQAFAASSQKTYRTALAGQVRDYVSNLADDASNDVIVASAVDMLLRSGTEDSQAKVLLGSLTSDDNAMLTVNTEISGSADAVVVIAPDTLYAQAADGATPTADAEADAEAAAQTALYASAVSAFADRGPTVSIGTATNDTDVLSVIRAQGKGSTVDSRGTVLAALNGAFAVGNEILGEHVALGTQAGATAALGTRSEAAAPAEPEQSTPETEAPASNEEGQG